MIIAVVIYLMRNRSDCTRDSDYVACDAEQRYQLSPTAFTKIIQALVESHPYELQH